MMILINVLPRTSRHSICLVHDTDVRPLGITLTPMVPSSFMRGALSEGVEVLDGLPVGEVDEGVAAAGGGHSHGV